MLAGGPTLEAQDHLLPESGILQSAAYQRNYARKLRIVLLKHAAEYYTARLVCTPSFEPEWVVTVVRTCDQGNYAPDHPHTYSVVCVAAKENLWYAKKFQEVKVRRRRVPLDRDTAETVAEVWRRMLVATHYPEKPPEGFVTDTTRLHFSRAVPWLHQGRFDPHAGFEQGYLEDPPVDERGHLTGQFIALGKDLKKYALAKPGDREKARQKVRARAEQLKSSLDRIATQPK
jgi:hypothetical protein